MRSQIRGFGGKYESICRRLTNKQLLDIALKVQNSGLFEIGEFSHIVLRGTDTIIGYVGNDSADLCCPEDKKPEIYRIPHSHLRKIFMSV